MVNSQVPFPEDWKRRSLSELSDGGFQNGLFFEVDRKNKGVPIINVGDLYGDVPISNRMALFDATIEEIKSFGVKSGDIFFTRSSIVPSGIAMCNVYLSEEEKPVVFDSHVIKYSANREQVNPVYLALQCRMPFARNHLIGRAKTATMTTIDQKGIGSCPIYMPDVPEQDAIVDTLATFDTYIANLSELIEKKKAIRDGALEDLVSGKTRLSGYENNVKRNTSIGAIQKVERGKRLIRSQLKKRGDYPVYQNSMVPLGYYDESNCLSHSVFVIAAGSAGEIGFSDTAFWAADDCYYFTHCSEICQKYLYYVLLREQEYLRLHSRRTSIPRLSRDVIDDIQLSLPIIDEQQAIANVLSAMDDEINALEDERNKMIQIREGAMDDLLTGRVRLPI